MQAFLKTAPLYVGLFEHVWLWADFPCKATYERKDAITDFIHGECKALYGQNVTKEDIFYYIYGLLHSPEYRKTFANDLKKSLPRLPLVDKPETF